MHDLLNDPLIGVRTAQGSRRLNLPELLAALSGGQVDGYTGLRAHQADPWHVFLVQLAASIQARFPTDALPIDAGYWREGLLDLADGIPEAWQLLVEDVTKPAFLQHPWKSWEAEAAAYGVKTNRGQIVYAPKASSPDELDVLVTSKNHDVKMARLDPQTVEAWMYALVLLQTTSGFLGQGNYGIVRMNGGFASRSIIAWARSLSPHVRFADDTRALRGLRDKACADVGYSMRGIVLTWLTPWNRNEHQWQLAQLEPWFIEAARPIRLCSSENGGLLALGATSKARQIGPQTVDNGDIVDPWTVINVGDKKKGRSALTLSSDGFTPQRLTDLLFEQGFELTPLQKPQSGDGDGWFVASCLVRGQGKTEGFHRAQIPIPAKARRTLLQNASRETLGKLGQQLLGDAKDVQRALATALTVLSEGGPEKADFERVETWINARRSDFAKTWEQRYFPTLWRGADEAHEVVRRDWQQRLVDAGQALLDEAAACLPLPSNRRWRSLTQAESAWRGVLHKAGLPLPGRATTESTQPEEQTA